MMWILSASVAGLLALVWVLVARVRRQTAELVTLTRDLEARVAERTAALEERTRELTDANAARSRFFARVSHEIRTPLSGILGVNRMLLQTPLAGRQRELADIVQAQGDTLLAIINDILDYSKMEAGRFRLAPTEFSIRETVDEASRVYGEQARARHVQFLVESDPAIPERVTGDAVRLRQVLDNLLSNAVKFTDTGSITLRVTRLASAPSEVSAKFEVADTGIGFGAAAARVLFQPFIQDESTGRAEGGTGLGLAIAKSLVEMMGGDIGCVGTPGRGSTFWFTIRVGAVTGSVDNRATGAALAPSPRVPPRTESEPGITLRAVPHGRVLVAEDNAVNRMVTVAILEGAGCTVDVVSTGVEAVAACARLRYDLVLMDCRMPELDGYHAAQQIRLAEGAMQHVPIVALTAQAVDGERERCVAAGMDDCITKPATPEVIAQLLDRWCRRPDAPVVAATLDDLEARSPAVLRAVIEHYLAGIPTDMAHLQTAIDNGHVERVRSMAHDLAGSALVVGARTLAGLLRQAEHDDTVALDAWFTAVDAEHRRVLDALRQRSVRATSSSQCSTNTN